MGDKFTAPAFWRRALLSYWEYDRPHIQRAADMSKLLLVWVLIFLHIYMGMIMMILCCASLTNFKWHGVSSGWYVIILASSDMHKLVYVPLRLEIACTTVPYIWVWTHNLSYCSILMHKLVPQCMGTLPQCLRLTKNMDSFGVRSDMHDTRQPLTILHDGTRFW